MTYESIGNVAEDIDATIGVTVTADLSSVHNAATLFLKQLRIVVSEGALHEHVAGYDSAEDVVTERVKPLINQFMGVCMKYLMENP